MAIPKIHIIHAGIMDNKGTEALLLSDVKIIKDFCGNNVEVSVSTSDVENVKKYENVFNNICPPILDIPYQAADKLAHIAQYDRTKIKYKITAFACLLYMLLQTILSISSAILIKYNLKGHYRRDSIRRIKDSNLVISCSGENFKEGSSLLPFNLYWKISWWSMLFCRTWEVLIAKYFNKKVLLFPNSVGPFKTRIGTFLSELALNNFLIALIRDPISFEIVSSSFTVSNKILTGDTALLFQSQKNVTKPNVEHIVGVNPGIYGHSLRSESVARYIDSHVEAIDFGIEKYGFQVVLLPHFVSGFKQDDMELCKQIFDKTKRKDNIKIYHAQSVDDFKSFLDSLDMLISSKMHPAILASSGFVPTISIAYDHKQTGFFRRLNLENCVIEIGKITSKELIEKIDYVWTNKERIRDILRSEIPLLQENIKMNIRRSLLEY